MTGQGVAENDSGATASDAEPVTRRRRWDGVDVVAFMLAAAVLLVVVTFGIIGVADEIRGRPTVMLASDTLQVINDVIGSVVALLGAYIGYRVGEARHRS